MSGRIKRHRKGVAVVAGITAALVAVAAWAYWTGGGSGTGSVTTGDTVSALVVSQNASTGALAPGTSVPLLGQVTNPNTTDVKVGALTAEITGVSGGAAVGDFSLTGNPVAVNAVVKKGTPLTWSGMTLVYANSAANQDNGKNATVSIKYTLAPFSEPVVPVVPPMGTFSYTNGLLSVANVAVWPTATGDMTVTAGDQLFVHVPAGGWDSASDTLVVNAVGGKFNYAPSTGYYILHYPGVLQLKRAGVFYPRTPAWTLAQ